MKKRRNQVTVINEDSKFRINKKAAAQIALNALNHLKYSGAHLNLVFTSDAKIKKINRRFLDHHWATDVLAFPSLRGGIDITNCRGRPACLPKGRTHGFAPTTGPRNDGVVFLGEVVISPKRALVQAPLYGATLNEELARYMCHGILHLAGFKDKRKKDQERMRRQENKLLSLSKQEINRIIKNGD